MKNRSLVAAVVPFLGIVMLASPLAAQDWGNKMLDRLQINFGSVARMADTTFKLNVKNPFLEEIRITSLTTSCGCISWVDQAPISIPSRGERELIIRLDTVRFSGDRHVKAFITLNEASKGLTSVVTIPVDGRIRTDVEVRPSSVPFGAIDLGQGYLQRINVTYNGPSDWKITSAKVNSPYLSTKLVEQSRNGGTVQYEVIVELKPNAPAGTLRDQLILATNEAGNPQISVPVDAKIESDIVVTDAQFGAVAPGHPKSVTVILRGKKPFQIEKAVHVAREVVAKPSLDGTATTSTANSLGQQSNDAFKIEFANTVSQIHMVTLTVTPTTQSGMFDETFSVVISGRSQPVIVRASGRILDEAVTNASR